MHRRGLGPVILRLKGTLIPRLWPEAGDRSSRRLAIALISAWACRGWHSARVFSNDEPGTRATQPRSTFQPKQRVAATDPHRRCQVEDCGDADDTEGKPVELHGSADRAGRLPKWIARSDDRLEPGLPLLGLFREKQRPIIGCTPSTKEIGSDPGRH
jgi:hypothetical protein